MFVSLQFLLFCIASKWLAKGNVCNKPSTTLVTVIENTRAQLACNTSESSPSNKLQLIFWYKDSSNIPFYNIDMRNKTVIYAERGRTYFDQSTGYFFIPNVQPEDQGHYCCRVDFQNSPTRYYAINLSVIILPSAPVITDEHGVQLGPTSAPYNEGFALYLSCKVEKGHPRPTVTWWHNAVPVNDTRQFISSGVIRTDLTVLSLAPTHFRTTYTCKATNTNITSPMTTSITIDMNLKPIRVEMQRPPRPLSAQKKSQLTCQCVGSRPEASITWWLGRIKLLTTHQYTSLDGNSTESVVTFTPSSTDNGKILVCRAHNPLVPNSEITDNWTLNIYYRPVVTVELTAPPNKWNIIENSNVFLECHIASNPYVLSVTWKFKSKILANDPANGISISEQSLVIQSVQAHHVGEYVCVATNGEGQGQSEVFDLQIKHKPICSKRQQSKYSFVANNQTLVISCQVEAHPANVTFHWTSASAKGTKTLLPFESLVNQTKSSILYTVDSESDLGTVSCWATNQIGTQIKHCVFHILYAVKPHPLRNCTLYNISHSSFQVQCIAKYDDGLAYNFTIEVQDGRTSKLVTALTQPSADFQVTKLEPSQRYVLKVYATNAKGTSDIVEIMAQMLKQNQTLNVGDNGSAIPEWHILTAILAFLLAVVVATIVLLRYKKQQIEQQLNRKNFMDTLSDEDQLLSQQILYPDEITYCNCSKKKEPHLPLCWRYIWHCCNNKKQEHRVYDCQNQAKLPKQWKKVKIEENLETILLTNVKTKENTTSEYKQEQRRHSWMEMNF